MNEKLKSFLEENKDLIRENRWCELYYTSYFRCGLGVLAKFLFNGLGAEIMLDCFSKEGKIPVWAFFGCTGLTRVIVPEGITEIGNQAFCFCENLQEIIIPNSVAVIGESAFSNCSSLPEITIPNSVDFICNWAFFDCTGLRNITFENGITNIGDEVFEGCENLESITIPSSVTHIGEGAFKKCKCHIIFECDKRAVTKVALKGFKGTYEFR